LASKSERLQRVLIPLCGVVVVILQGQRQAGLTRSVSRTNLKVRVLGIIKHQSRSLWRRTKSRSLHR
jgi:cobyrinic acid a,c-diamide synthase